MGNKLKKAAPWIAGLILIWHAHGAVGEGGGGGAKLKESLLRIPSEVMAVKPDTEAAVFEHDPFFIEWAPYGPTYDPVYIAQKKREAEEREKRERAEALKKQLAEREAQKTREEAERQARIEADEARRKEAAGAAPGGSLGYEPFYLTLESVLAMRDFATARVSGQNVEIGATLDTLDPRKPPRVLGIEGTRVTIVHRGKRYVLDLLGETRIAVGGTPRAQPGTTAPGAGASGATRPPKKTAVGGGGVARRRPGSLKKPPKKTAVSK